MSTPPQPRVMWLIDAGYINQAALTNSVHNSFSLDYKRLKDRVVTTISPNVTTFYLDTLVIDPDGERDSSRKQQFHKWLQNTDHGPGMIVKTYPLKSTNADSAFCTLCQKRVVLTCPHSHDDSRYHPLRREQQKGVDVGLAVLATTRVNDYDILLLSSGDGDLLDAVEYVIGVAKKQLQLLGFKNGLSTDLQCRASKIHWIDDFKHEVNRQDNVPPTRRN